MEATVEARVGLVRARRQAGELGQSRCHTYEDRPRASVPGRPRREGGRLTDLSDQSMAPRPSDAPGRGGDTSWWSA